MLKHQEVTTMLGFSAFGSIQWHKKWQSETAVILNTHIILDWNYVVLSWLFHACNRDISSSSCKLSRFPDFLINPPTHVSNFQKKISRGVQCRGKDPSDHSCYLPSVTGNGQKEERRGQVLFEVHPETEFLCRERQTRCQEGA